MPHCQRLDRLSALVGGALGVPFPLVRWHHPMFQGSRLGRRPHLRGVSGSPSTTKWFACGNGTPSAFKGPPKRTEAVQ